MTVIWRPVCWFWGHDWYQNWKIGGTERTCRRCGLVDDTTDNKHPRG